jgi:hypothetical protein
VGQLLAVSLNQFEHLGLLVSEPRQAFEDLCITLLHIYVREADDWKIRVAAMNVTPDSVLLINKTFASQPAATPSPTTSPSTQ